MNRKMLLVVDMQNDFISGSLGSSQAKAIVPRVAEKIRMLSSGPARGETTVVLTQDTHGEDYLQTQEGKRLPVPHCIEHSDGWKLDPQILDAIGTDAILLSKPTFGCTGLIGLLQSGPLPQEIEIAGLCTDICVISNAMLLKAFFPQIPIVVDAGCCAGVTPQSHQTALDAMRACQIDIRGA